MADGLQTLRSRSVLCAYIALAAGSVSAVLSLAWLVTLGHVVFHFAYVQGTVNLLLANEAVHEAVWLGCLTVLCALTLLAVGFSNSAINLLSLLLLLLAVLSLSWSTVGFPLLAGVNLLYLIVLLRSSQRVFSIPPKRAVAVVAAAAFTSFLPIGAVALLQSLTNPSAVLSFYAGSEPLAALTLNITNAGEALSPMILLSLIILSALILFTHRRAAVEVAKAYGFTRNGAIGLFGALVVSAFIAYLPYFYRQNPLGVDAPWYMARLQDLNGGGSPLVLAWTEPHAAYILLLFGLQNMLRLSAADAVKLGVVLLSASLTAAVYLFAGGAFRNQSIALLSAYLAALSPQTLVGGFAGIFENWLAVVLVYLFLAFLTRAMRSPTLMSNIGGAATILLVTFVHVWTWVILIIILAALVTLRAARAHHLTFKTLFSSLHPAIIVSVIVAEAAILASPASRTAITFGLTSVAGGMQASPANFLEGLSVTLTNYVLGFYSNWILLLLALVGLAYTARIPEEASALLQAWTLVLLGICAFMSPNGQWRLLYILPYPVLAALGITAFTKFLTQGNSEGLGTYLATHTLVASILLMLLIYAVNAELYMAM